MYVEVDVDADVDVDVDVNVWVLLFWATWCHLENGTKLPRFVVLSCNFSQHMALEVTETKITKWYQAVEMKNQVVPCFV